MKRPREFVIKDARTFYSTIKANPLYTGRDDEEMILALKEYFLARFRAANSDGLDGPARDEYMFFQGMLAGCLVAWKQIKHHIAVEAANQNINPETGKSHDPNH